MCHVDCNTGNRRMFKSEVKSFGGITFVGTQQMLAGGGLSEW